MTLGNAEVVAEHESLRRALADMLRIGEALRVGERHSLGSLAGLFSEETLASARDAWRVGNHAGRLMRLREALYDIAEETR
jgi:cell division inhibitor SulA